MGDRQARINRFRWGDFKTILLGNDRHYNLVFLSGRGWGVIKHPPLPSDSSKPCDLTLLGGLRVGLG